MGKLFDSGINSKLYFRFYLDYFYVSVVKNNFKHFIIFKNFIGKKKKSKFHLGSGAAAKTFDQYFVVANSRNY